MNYTDEEVELINEAHQLRKRYIASKDGGDDKEYAEAKAAMSAHRTFWRQIREVVQEEDDDFPPQDAAEDGVAATKTVAVASEVKEV